MNNHNRLSSILHFPLEDLQSFPPESSYKLLMQYKDGAFPELRPRDWHKVLKMLPAYVQCWWEHWDEFHGEKYHHKSLDEDKELAWGMFCYARGLSVFNYYAIPHVRHIPLLQKVADNVDKIELSKVFRLLGSSAQIQPHLVPYSQVFLPKIIFAYRPNSIGYLRWIFTLLDDISYPVTLHPDNDAEIHCLVHPNIRGSVERSLDVNKAIESIDLYVLLEQENPTLWEWCWACETHALRQKPLLLDMMCRTDIETVGCQIEYCIWTVDSVQKIYEKLAPKYREIADFYIQYHAFFGDKLYGKDIVSYFKGNDLPAISAEISLII